MKIIILLTSIFLMSCSLTGRNIVQQNDFEIAGGSVGDKSWEDELKLKRTSWYQEMTMVFDVLYGEITPDSAFYKWFSTSEKVSLKRCSNSYLTLYYSSASDVISKSDFVKQASEQGYDLFTMNDFSKALKLHPQYISNSFQLYNIAILCTKSNLGTNLKVEFPNFRPVTF